MYSELWQSKNNEEFVDRVSEIPLFTSPNTEWRYGVNTDICGYLIEVLSGQLWINIYLNSFLNH